MIENHNFPGLCHLFRVDRNHREQRFSISTQDEPDAERLKTLYELGELPTDLRINPLAFSSEAGKAKLESTSETGIDKLADRLRRQGRQVE